MSDLFHSYWWLIFPLGWFVSMGWTSWMNYRRDRDRLALIRTYAEKGQEPPAELLKVLNRDEDVDEWGERRSDAQRSRPWPWQSMVVLFGVLSAGFAWANWADLYGAGGAFAIVSFTMGAVALAFLVTGLVTRPPRG